MGELQFKRECDNANSAKQPLNLAGLAGRWRSSDPETLGIDSVELVVSDDGGVDGNVFGADGDELIDWGTVPVSALFAEGISSATCAGFQLHYDLPSLKSHIQVNLKLGVLVLGVHQSFKKGNQHHDCFFREFMAVTERLTEPLIHAFEDRSCTNDEILGSTPPALGLLLGSWSNTNRSTRGIVELELEPFDNAVRVRVRGAGSDGPIDWGWVHGRVFSCCEEDSTHSAAAMARYDFGFFDCEFQFRQNKGILAVTMFNRFHDGGGRSDYVTRELFHRKS